ncbi:MAG: GNAT family N-acetyltransferase [Salaquimonas sp.]
MEHLSTDKIQLAKRLSSDAVINLNAGAPGLTWRVVSGVEEILGLESAWRKLELDCPNTVLFQSFDWCQNYLSFRAADESNAENFKPVVVTLWENKVLVGLMPLALQAKGRMTVLTGFSEPFQQYTEILLNPSIGKSKLRQVFLDSLKSTGADYFHFGQVRQDGQLARLLEGVVSPSGEQDAAPYVSLQAFDGYDEYLKTVKSKTRKNLRNARNRLERDAPVVHHIARHGDLMAQVVKRAYEGREAWLESLGITSRAFRDDDFQAFLNCCADDEQAKGIDTIAMSLTHGDTPISDQWGFVYRGRYYAFMATWNPDYEAASPGRLHLGEVIKTCFDEGFETADFMIPAASYKLTWTADAAPVRDYVLAISTRGTIYAKLWLDFARPLSKRIFFKLPAGLRGLLVKKILPTVE